MEKMGDKDQAERTAPPTAQSTHGTPVTAGLRSPPASAVVQPDATPSSAGSTAVASSSVSAFSQSGGMERGETPFAGTPHAPVAAKEEQPAPTVSNLAGLNQADSVDVRVARSPSPVPPADIANDGTAATPSESGSYEEDTEAPTESLDAFSEGNEEATIEADVAASRHEMISVSGSGRSLPPRSTPEGHRSSTSSFPSPERAYPISGPSPFALGERGVQRPSVVAGDRFQMKLDLEQSRSGAGGSVNATPANVAGGQAVMDVTQSQHRARLRLSTSTTPPVVVLDPPVTSQVLEVASTHTSSLAAISLPSSVAGFRAEGTPQDAGSRGGILVRRSTLSLTSSAAGSGAGGARPPGDGRSPPHSAQGPLSPPPPASLTSGHRWAAAPLFTSTDDDELVARERARTPSPLPVDTAAAASSAHLDGGGSNGIAPKAVTSAPTAAFSSTEVCEVDEKKERKHEKKDHHRHGRKSKEAGRTPTPSTRDVSPTAVQEVVQPLSATSVTEPCDVKVKHSKKSDKKHTTSTRDRRSSLPLPLVNNPPATTPAATTLESTMPSQRELSMASGLTHSTGGGAHLTMPAFAHHDTASATNSRVDQHAGGTDVDPLPERRSRGGDDVDTDSGSSYSYSESYTDGSADLQATPHSSDPITPAQEPRRDATTNASALQPILTSYETVTVDQSKKGKGWRLVGRRSSTVTRVLRTVEGVRADAPPLTDSALGPATNGTLNLPSPSRSGEQPGSSQAPSHSSPGGSRPSMPLSERPPLPSHAGTTASTAEGLRAGREGEENVSVTPAVSSIAESGQEPGSQVTGAILPDSAEGPHAMGVWPKTPSILSEEDRQSSPAGAGAAEGSTVNLSPSPEELFEQQQSATTAIVTGDTITSSDAAVMAATRRPHEMVTGEMPSVSSASLAPSLPPSPMPPPLRAFYVYIEELPRLFAFDAQLPRFFAYEEQLPVSLPGSEDEDAAYTDGSEAEDGVKESSEERQKRETAAAQSAADGRYAQTLAHLAVHPPRQCLYVELKDLQRLACIRLFPRYAPQPLPAPQVKDDTTAVLALDGEADWKRLAGLDVNTGLSGVPPTPPPPSSSLALPSNATCRTLPPCPSEDPQWVKVRLALYSTDGHQCIATGASFLLPANPAALYRSGGALAQSKTSADVRISGMNSTSDAGAIDGRSEVLVFQLPEKMPATVVSPPPVREVAEAERDTVRNGEEERVRCKKADAGASPSPPPVTELYLRLEEHTDGKQVTTTATATEVVAEGQTTPSSVEPSLPEQPVLPPPSTPLEVLTSEAEAEAEEEKEDSVTWQTTSSQTSSRTPAPNAAEGVTASVIVSPAPEKAAPETTPAESRRFANTGPWSVLAASVLIPLPKLRRSSRKDTLISTPLDFSPGDDDHATAMNPLPCRLRWAVEPTLDELVSTPDPEGAESRAGAAWGRLVGAISEQERQRIGSARDLYRTGGGCLSSGAFATGPAFTVLWDTIHSPAAAQQCRDASVAAIARKQAQALYDAERRGSSSGQRPQSPSSSPSLTRPTRPTVCSVEVRCSMAVLLRTPFLFREHPEAYCAGTTMTVTGGVEGIVAHVEAPATHQGCPNRAPVIHYDGCFHTILTREEAASLLFTVHVTAAPTLVFGFAECNPFDLLEQVNSNSGSSSGGVIDLWLPLFTPAAAATTVAPPHERQRSASPSPSVTPAPSPLSASSAAVAAAVAPNLDEETATIEAPPVVPLVGGMLHTGWLHCDLRVTFPPTLSEAGVRLLWNGARYSLASLARHTLASTYTAPAAVSRGREEVEDVDSLLDICVVEAAGLRPLSIRFGVVMPPAPLRWAAQESVAGPSAGTTNEETCARVYCEVVAMEMDNPARNRAWTLAGSHRPSVSADASGARGLLSPPSDRVYALLSALTSPTPQDLSAISRGQDGWVGTASGPSVARASAADGRRDVEDGMSAGGGGGGMAALLTGPPVTAVVANTCHPRWNHIFRCGFAQLDVVYLRFFDRPSPATTASAGTEEQGRRLSVSRRRGVQLGAVPVSAWLLRTVMAQGSEGQTWMPLLWTPTSALAASRRDSAGATTAADSPMAVDMTRRSPVLSPAKCNGYVLLQWRRLSTRSLLMPETWSRPADVLALPRDGQSLADGNQLTGEGTSYAHVTRRSRLHISYSSVLRLRSGALDGAAAPAIAGAPSLRFPSKWYQPRTLLDGGEHRLGWQSPQLAPWLCVHQLRVQWPWLQHVLYMHGGHLRLSLLSYTSRGETQEQLSFPLVPLQELCPADSKGEGYGQRRRATRVRDDGGGAYGLRARVHPALPETPYAPSSPAPATVATEASFCLAATPFVFFQLWWHPGPCITEEEETEENAKDMEVSPTHPPAMARLLGSGRWSLPAAAMEADAQRARGNSAGLAYAANEAETASQTTSLPSSSSSTTTSLSASGADATSLQCFFVPHEAEVRIMPHPHVDESLRHVPCGLLTWRLTALPRLQPDTLANQSTKRASAADPSSSGMWRWPEVGTAAVVQLQVLNMLWFDPHDQAATTAGALSIVVEEAAREGTSASLEKDLDVAPVHVVSSEVPRVRYAHRQLATAPVPGPNGSTSYAAGVGTEEDGNASVSQQQRRYSLALSTSARAETAVELRWTPRRFEWLGGDAPTLILSVVAAFGGKTEGRKKKDDTGSAAVVGECVHGTVQLPRLAAFEDYTGILWLPMMRSSTHSGEASGTGPFHVGFVAVEYVHNFVKASAEGLPRCSVNHGVAVHSASLLVVLPGPIRWREEHSGAATNAPTELLVGFADCQRTVLVRETEESNNNGSSEKGSADTETLGPQSKDVHAAPAEILTFPWPIQSGDAAVEALRIQARSPASRPEAAATLPPSLASNTLSLINTPGSGNVVAQWVPLQMRTGGGGGSSAKHAPQATESRDRVIAEVLLRWRVVDASPDTTSISGEGDAMAMQLRRLVEAYCGGPGAPCTVTALDQVPVTGLENGRRNTGVGAEGLITASSPNAAERVREWVAEDQEAKTDPTTASQAMELPAKLLRVELRKILPCNHPCVYLTVGGMRLQCSAAQLKAWYASSRHGDGARHSGLRLGLVACLEWPSEWSSEWLRVLPRQTASVSAEAEKEQTPSPTQSTTMAPVTRSPSAPAASVRWWDVDEDIFEDVDPPEDGELPSRSTSTAASEEGDMDGGEEDECTLTCSALQLCMPLPCMSHVLAAQGPAGLARSCIVSFRLFLVSGDESALSEEDGAPSRVTRMFIGSGRTPIVHAHRTHYGMTTLHPLASEEKDAEGGAAAAVAATTLLRWSTSVCTSLPSPSLDAREMQDGTLTETGTPGGGWSHCKRGVDEPHLRSLVLVRLTVQQVVLAGVDVSLAVGTAERHCRPLPPATITAEAAAPSALRNSDRGTLAIRGSPAVPEDDTTPEVALMSYPTVELAPSLVTKSNGTAMSSAGVAVAASPSEKRYSWTAEMCALAQSQLVLHVRIPRYSLRSARGAEMWSSRERRRDGDGTSVEEEEEQIYHQHMEGVLEGGATDDEVVCGRAVLNVNAAQWAHAQLQGGAHRRGRSRENVPAAAFQEMVLELVEADATDGRWSGRLTLRADYLAVDGALRAPRSLFFARRLTVSVGSCQGFLLGDLALAQKVRETYLALRDRAHSLFDQRGRVPRGLRRKLVEVRQLWRQLRELTHAGQDGNSGTAESGRDATVVRMTAAWEDEGGVKEDGAAAPQCASLPFRLVSVVDVVSHPTRLLSSVFDPTGKPGLHRPLLQLSRVLPAKLNARSPASMTVALHVEPAVLPTPTFLPLADARSTVSACSVDSLLGIGGCIPMLASTNQQAIVPFSIAGRARGGDEKDGVEPRAVLRPRLSTVTVDRPATAQVTAQWSAATVHGDTYLSCLLITQCGQRVVHAGQQRWTLRFVYGFNVAAEPELEHCLDTALHLQSFTVAAVTAMRGSVQGMPAGDATMQHYCSGAVTRLPAVGSMGGTLRRVELLEALPVSVRETADASSSTEPSRRGYGHLAAHTWSAEDELALQALRQDALTHTSDARIWLILTSRGGGGGGTCYRVLLGLHTANGLARLAAQRVRRQLAGEGRVATAAEVDPLLQTTSGLPLRRRLQKIADVNALRVLSKPTHDPKENKTLPSSGGSGAMGVGGCLAGCHGGVVLHSALFHCSTAALAAHGFSQADTVICRVVSEETRSSPAAATSSVVNRDSTNDASGETPVIVLDAGNTPLSRRQPVAVALRSGDASRPSTPPLTTPKDDSIDGELIFKSPLTSSNDMYAQWPPSATSAALSVTAPGYRLGTPARSLLRLVLPTQSGEEGVEPALWSGGTGTSEPESATPMLTELRWVVQVEVRMGEATLQYASPPFTVSSVLCHRTNRVQTLYGGLGVNDFGWTSDMELHRTAPITAASGASVRLELRWGLDILGICPTIATTPAFCAADPSFDGTAAHLVRTRGKTDNNGEEVEEEEDEAEEQLRQVESCSAWADFLASQESVEAIAEQPMHLEHWRCRIAAVEVDGLELARWGTRMVQGYVAPAFPATVHTSPASLSAAVAAMEVAPTLLAQLIFPTAVDALVSGGGEAVMGVARTTASSTDIAAAGSFAEEPGREWRQRRRGHGRPTGVCYVPRSASARLPPPRLVQAGAGAWTPINERGGRLRYQAVFGPLPWSIGLPDMMQHCDTEETDRSAGLTLWQLLPSADAPSSSATETEKTRSQEAYGLGALGLVRLLQEGALYLVQVLRRWSIGACTLDERDALLSAAAAVPTRWMELADLSSPSGLEEGRLRAWENTARVRFYYVFTYHGPAPVVVGSDARRLPAPAPMPLPHSLRSDAVLCAQLDHLQLRYNAASFAPMISQSSEDKVRSWLGRLVLVLRVKTTWTDAKTGDLLATRTVAQFCTGLAVGAAAPQHQSKERMAGVISSPPPSAGRSSRPLSATSSPAPASSLRGTSPRGATDRPVTPEVAALPLDFNGTVTSSASDAACDSDVCIPALPTRGLFYWHPSDGSNAEGGATEDDGRVQDHSNSHHRRPASSSMLQQAVEVTTVHVHVVLPAGGARVALSRMTKKNSASDLAGAEVAGEVVGRGRFCVGQSSTAAVHWNSRERCVDGGWRLAAPLEVRLPIRWSSALLRELRAASGGIGAGVAPADASVQLPPFLCFHFLAFISPSWGLTTALEAWQRQQTERRLRTWSTLEGKEAGLLAATTGPSQRDSLTGDQEETGEEGSVKPLTGAPSLCRVSESLALHPFQILKVPPPIYALSTLAITSMVPVLHTAEERDGEMTGSYGQSLWVPPTSGLLPALLQRQQTTEYIGLEAAMAWLVDSMSGVMRVPVWHSLPTFSAHTDAGASALRLHYPTLPPATVSTSHWQVVDRTHFALEWRRNSSTAVSPLSGTSVPSSLAGLVGAAAVSYTAESGASCVWVCGGLQYSQYAAARVSGSQDTEEGRETHGGLVDKPMLSPSPPPTTTPRSHRALIYTTAFPLVDSGEGAVAPFPAEPRRLCDPLWSPGAPRSLLFTAPRTNSAFYRLYTAHFLRCEAWGDSASSSEKLPRWSCTITTPSPASSADTRLLHTATVLKGRVWLLGGWTVEAGVDVLPTTHSTGGFVSRRRREVGRMVTRITGRRRMLSPYQHTAPHQRHAAQSGNAASPEPETAGLLRWCSTVGCMRWKADGTPEPVIDMAPRATGEEKEHDEEESRGEVAPRMAGHVAVPCGAHEIACFGGLVPHSQDPRRAVCTASLFYYDTETYRWTTAEPLSGAWPMARYGHSCALVPGTGKGQPSSYFIFGGATTTAQGEVLVSSDEALWLWTPASGGEEDEWQWRNIAMPSMLSAGLHSRFLPQLWAITAAEAMERVPASERSDRDVEEEVKLPGSPGVAFNGEEASLPMMHTQTSFLLTVAGGMRRAAVLAVPPVEPEAAGAESAESTSSALALFQRYVEPWFSHQVGTVVTAQLTCVCERPSFLPLMRQP